MKWLSIVLLFSIYSCQQRQNTSQKSEQDAAKVQAARFTDEFLITDSTFGKISKASTYNDLEKIFGKEVLKDTISYGAEGMDSFVVTKIFSNTSKELIINWQMDKFHTAIGKVDCSKENSLYHTADSLQVGSTLEKLVNVNGKKINFYGTGWDYGGLITSYNNGKFEKTKLFFSLNSRGDASEKIMGDRELNTDMPIVKANLQKLYISQISLSMYSEKRQ